MAAATLFASVNVALLFALIYMYSRILMKTRAAYSMGLLIFAILLLFHNMMTVFGYVTMTSFFGDQIYPVLFGITVLEFGGLVALLKVTI